MTNLYTKSKFANGVGVTASGISKRCKGLLKNAMVGKYIDVDHEVVKSYLVELRLKGHKITLNDTVKPPKPRLTPIPKPKPRPRKIKPPPPLKIDEPDLSPAPIENRKTRLPKNVSEYADWTLDEIVNEFGTAEAFEIYFKAFKRMCDIREKVIKIDERAGLLVSRRLVEISVLDPVNAAHERLLSDGKKTIARRLLAAVKADEEINVLETIVSKELTAHIRPLKSKIQRALADAN